MEGRVTDGTDMIACQQEKAERAGWHSVVAT